MRRVTLGFLLTISALVLLFSYHTSTDGSSKVGTAGAASLVGGGAAGGPTTSVTPNSPGADAGPGGNGAGPGGSTGAGQPTTTTPGSSRSGTLVIDGATVDTRHGPIYAKVWRVKDGPVQVRVTFTGSKITQVDAIVVPDQNGRDLRINQIAIPILHDEVIAAQSANIDSISGATVTTDGYVASLQSAIDLFHQQK